MTGRTRNKEIKARLTQQEYDQIKAKIAKSGLSQQRYVIASLQNAEIKMLIIPPELAVALKRQGNNLNQIARRLHEASDESCQDLDSLIPIINNILKEQQQLIRYITQEAKKWQ